MGVDSDHDMGLTHKVEFSPDARIIVVETLKDYRALIDACGRDIPESYYSPACRGIDYERLPGDALFITEAALREDTEARTGTWDWEQERDVVTDHDAARYEDPSPWDLTSGIVLNKHAITMTVIVRPAGRSEQAA